MAELWRRLLLLIGVTVAICMAMFADLAPRISVEQVDFASEQKNPGHMGLFSEKKRYLASLPLEKYIQEVIKGREVQQTDGTQRAFAEQAGHILGNPTADSEWRERLGPGPTLWLKAGEFPPGSLIRQLGAAPGQSLFLSYDGQIGRQHLKLSLHTYHSDNFLIGSGYSGSRLPPTEFFFPLRSRAWIPALTGLLIYLFYPRHGRERDSMSFSRWRMLAGDSVSMILFSLFFGLPFFICSAIQATSCWWMLALFLWPLALCGLWILKINSWYASFRIHFIPGGIHLRSYSLDEKIAYSTLKNVTPAILKNPRWLTALLALGSIAGSGSSQARMAGQSLLLSSASYGGLHFQYKDGRSFYLWHGDQLGNTTFSGISRLIDEIQTAGLLDESKVMEKRALATEVRIESPKGPRSSIKTPGPLLKFALTPLLILFIFIVGGNITSNIDAPDPAAIDISQSESRDHGIPRPMPELPLLEQSEKSWQQTFGGGQIVYGDYVVQAENNDIVTAGEIYNGRSDILLLRTNSNGGTPWKKTFGEAGDEKPGGLLATPDGAFLVAATKGPAGFRDIYLFKVDGSGELVWETVFGEKYTNESVVAITLNPDGTLAVLADIDYRTRLMHFSPSGKLVSQNMLSSGLADQRKLTGRDIIATSDGNLVICGELERTGSGFMDAFLLKLDQQGNLLWFRTYGEEGREGANTVRELPGGGFLLAGYTGLFGEGQQDILLVETDAMGEPAWQKVLSDRNDSAGQKILVQPAGGAMLLGQSTLPETSISYSTLHLFDAEGSVRWQRWLGQEISAADMAQLGPTEYIVTGMQGRSGSHGIAGDLVLLKVHPEQQ